MGEINVYDKIMIEFQIIRKNMEKFLRKSPSNRPRWFRNRIRSLLSRADTRGSADIIYLM